MKSSTSTSTTSRVSAMSRIYDILFNTNNAIYTMFLFFFIEICVNLLVIWNIKYTEIDWVAYMQEVGGIINNGTFNYTELKGDTGPLVYPAGFVYIFSGLYYLTSGGVNVRLGQYVFAFVYQLTLLFVFFIYQKTRKVPPYMFFFMCCASYRIHSIYVLRLFNDPIAMTILYAAICAMLVDRWGIACLLYSLAVSVKMNVLLFSPALFLLLMIRLGIFKTVLHLAICAFVQLALAAPFLLVDPVAYVSRSFEFSRQFLHQWTVNWRFLPEEIFLDRRFHILLLVFHVLCLLYLAETLWTRKFGGLWAVLSNTSELKNRLDSNDIILPLFTCNFIGMCFSRSLHYQFYAWYFHTIHYILCSTGIPAVFRILLLGLIELAWNTYPSTNESSMALHFCHFIILVAIFYGERIGSDTKVSDGKRTVLKKID